MLQVDETSMDGAARLDPPAHQEIFADVLDTAQASDRTLKPDRGRAPRVAKYKHGIREFLRANMHNLCLAQWNINGKYKNEELRQAVVDFFFSEVNPNGLIMMDARVPASELRAALKF